MTTSEDPEPPSPSENSRGTRSQRRRTRRRGLPTVIGGRGEHRLIWPWRRFRTRAEAAFFRGLQERWPTPPTIAQPVSQMCTASQFAEPDYERTRSLLRLPRHLHRKQWEFVYIYRSIELAELAGPERRGLVFGVGRERLPSLLVSKGCRIVATDLPVKEADGVWVGGKQHADSLDKLCHPRLVDRDRFYRNASFRAVNMKSIPGDLVDFDFCWSACALEHLGSLSLGLEFIRNSLKCLRPGGLAVHTTEFNLGSAVRTLKSGPVVVYRERDLVDFAAELRAAGHLVTLNLHPGAEPMDLMIDRDRDGDIHLRVYALDKIVATSIGIAIRKAA